MAAVVDTEERGWTLHYWGPTFKGRGEFIRLLFEAAAIPYTENNAADEIIASCDMAKLGTGYPYPAKSPPIVTGPNGFCSSQTPVILWTLGKKFGMSPLIEANEGLAMQVNLTVADFVGEGRLAFHAIKPTGGYLTQKEETQPRVEWFKTERLPFWLNHFEHCLSKAQDGGSSFFFEGKMTYADIAVFHALNATEAQFPELWGDLKSTIPKLVAFQSRMAEIPNIKAYLASDRVRPWAGDSMM
jgi:glutathione S-transferase